MNLIFSDFQDKDYDALINLWEATGLSRPERGDDLAVIRRTLDLGGKLLLMWQDTPHKLIGTAWLTHDGRRLYMHHFGIHPDFQGQGLSHPLLGKCMEFAKTLNMQVKLEVHRQNTPAVQLYQKAGFHYLGDYDVYIIRETQ